MFRMFIRFILFFFSVLWLKRFGFTLIQIRRKVYRVQVRQDVRFLGENNFL